MSKARQHYQYVLCCWSNGNIGQANYAASKAGLIGLPSVAREIYDAHSVIRNEGAIT